MVKLKNFYTQSELKELSDKELLALTTFGKDGNVYFYSKLVGITISEEYGNKEYNFEIKGKDLVSTKSKTTYNEVMIGKARYDLISKSIEANKLDEDRIKDLLKTIKTVVSDNIEKMTIQNMSIQNNTMASLMGMIDDSKIMVKEVTKNSSKSIDELNIANRESIVTINDELKSISEKWKNKIKKLDAFDVEAYNIKMKDLDIIIEAFKVLLKD